MWLITTLGYFSIVKKRFHPEDPDFQVRARTTEDLEKINKLMGMNHHIVTTYDSDYPHRILLNAGELAQLFSLLADTIDYRSFKDEIFRDKEQRDRYLTYHEVWYNLQRL